MCAFVSVGAEGGLPLSISSQLIAVLSGTPALEKEKALLLSRQSPAALS